MRYFKLSDDMEILDRWHLGAVTRSDGTEPPLWEGIPFHHGDVSTHITALGQVLDFSLTSFAVPITTRLLAEAIRETAGPDLQIIPIDIGGRQDMVVLNSLRLINCLDETRSEFLKWTEFDHRADLAGHYRQVTRLVLDPEAIPVDAHFFRVEKWPIALVVSDPVRSAMLRTGCVGATFTDVTPAVGN